MSAIARETKMPPRTTIDQIKEMIGIIQRLGCIHDAKTRVLLFAHLRLRFGILDHLCVEIETHHLQMRIGMGQFQGPSCWSTAYIKYTLQWGQEACLVCKLRQKSS